MKSDAAHNIKVGSKRGDCFDFGVDRGCRAKGGEHHVHGSWGIITIRIGSNFGIR